MLVSRYSFERKEHGSHLGYTIDLNLSKRRELTLYMARCKDSCVKLCHFDIGKNRFRKDRLLLTGKGYLIDRKKENISSLFLTNPPPISGFPGNSAFLDLIRCIPMPLYSSKPGISIPL
jgi:hypothetical protein